MIKTEQYKILKHCYEKRSNLQEIRGEKMYTNDDLLKNDRYIQSTMRQREKEEISRK